MFLKAKTFWPSLVSQPDPPFQRTYEDENPSWNRERRRPRLRLVVASARSCPASPSCAAEGTSTPPREARVGDPGGCGPWVPKSLQRIFNKSEVGCTLAFAKRPCEE